MNRGTMMGSATYRLLNLANEGHLAPGTQTQPTAQLTLDGSLMQMGGSLDIALLSPDDASRVWVTGSTTLLGGSLRLSCVAPCDLPAGTELVVLHSQGVLAGSFSELVTQGFGTGSFEFSIGTHDVLLRVTSHAAAVPEPAAWWLALIGLPALAATGRRHIAPIARA